MEDSEYKGRVFGECRQKYSKIWYPVNVEKKQKLGMRGMWKTGSKIRFTGTVDTNIRTVDSRRM